MEAPLMNTPFIYKKRKQTIGYACGEVANTRTLSPAANYVQTRYKNPKQTILSLRHMAVCWCIHITTTLAMRSLLSRLDKLSCQTSGLSYP